MRSWRWLSLLVVCALLTACELDETLTIRSAGDGTYVVRIAVEKQFGEVLDKLKSESQEKGFTVVSQSETPDRKVLVLRRDFHNVSELSDENDTYALRISHPSRFKVSYALFVTTRASAASNGFQKRTMRITMPVSITTASSGTASGHTVEWDVTNGGSLQVDAAGVVLPYGINGDTAIASLLVLAAIVVLLVFRRRRTAPICGSCGVAVDAPARFCGACGTAIRGTRSPAPFVTAGVLCAAAVFIGFRGVSWSSAAAHDTGGTSIAKLLSGPNPLVGHWKCVKFAETRQDGTEKTTTDFPYRLYRHFNDDGTWVVNRYQSSGSTFTMRGKFSLIDSSHFASEITEHPGRKWIGHKTTAEFERSGDRLVIRTVPEYDGKVPSNPAVRYETTFVANAGEAP